MTEKRVDAGVEVAGLPVPEMANVPTDWAAALKFTLPSDEDMPSLAALRAGSDPWKSRGETADDSLKALAALRPFVHVAKLQSQVVGYVTVERDGPVPGAAYLRNIVVRSDYRNKGLGRVLLNHALQVARDMFRKTIALRVDPANAPAVSFYRSTGFTTVATVVSKKSGKLRLLMSREL